MFELMTASSAVRSAIRENKTAQLKSLIQTGARDGMMTFDESLARLVARGRLPLAMAVSHAESDLHSLLSQERRVQ
jgi:twitching motility protein PilT